MRWIQITLAYDGTRYVGWQRQARGVSIQGLVEAALSAIEGEVVDVTGAGRTDAGVHALAQEASFVLRHPIPLDALVRAVNARLPPDVRVTGARQRPEGFNARFAARGKTYRYTILPGPVADPFALRWAWHVARDLDIEGMMRAIPAVRGCHDFAAFQSSGGGASTTTRTLRQAVCRLAEAMEGRGWWPCATQARPVLVELEGDGFLRHMVRSIVGTLVQIGLGRRPVEHLATVLASGDRRLVGPTAPAHGLCLMRVDYDDPAPLESAPRAP